MNKLYLWAIIITAAMLGATYYTVVLNSKGDATGDIVNLLAIAGAVALVLITIFVVVKYVRQMQTDTATGELADESWDNIGEYKNPVPMGWAIMFLGTMIWGMWYYVAGYPVGGFSQIGQYNEEVAEKNAKFEKEYAGITGDKLVDMGEAVFIAECAVCHGLKADGNDHQAADLTQRIQKEVVEYTIKNGSSNGLVMQGMDMPAGLVSDQADIDAVASYVSNGFKGNDKGAEVYSTVCAGCHGANGEGMDMVAPRLNGFDTKLIVNVLSNSKKGPIGTMPSLERLNPKQKEAVAAYVISISKGE